MKHRHQMWIKGITGSLILLATSAGAGEPALRPDLEGCVRDAEGKPVAAASVFVESAGPKKGYNPLCPSCYADCAKKTLSAYDGRFTLPSLDPTLRFGILVTAPGYKPLIIPRVDPVRRGLMVTLRALNVERLPAELYIRGRVTDEDGTPIAEASVEPRWFKTRGTHGFSPGVLDPLAVTDDQGCFVITAKERIEHASFSIKARGYAPKSVSKWVPGMPGQTVKLDRGVTVTGRLMHNGKPASGAQMGLVQADRSMEAFFGNLTTVCDDEGRFSFSNVGGGEECFVYGHMDSLKPSGSVPAFRLKTGSPGTTVTTEDLKVQPAHVLRGRVVLANGGEIPEHTVILLCRRDAWDQSAAELGPDGGFEFTGLPPESYSLCVRVRDYVLSHANLSLDRCNSDNLIGRVDSDITSLNVLMERVVAQDPGNFQARMAEIRRDSWDQTKTAQAPLAGAPPKK